MNRITVVLNILLAITVLALGALLYQGRTTSSFPSRQLNANTASGIPEERKIQANNRDDSNAVVLDRLAALDARLIAMEHRLPRSQDVSNDRPAIKNELSQQALNLANRRLFAMFPDGNLDQNDMNRYQAALSGLSADERLALTAAFTQAINTNRIKIRI